MPAASALSNTSATYLSIAKTVLSLMYTVEWLFSGIAFAIFIWGMALFIRHENVLEKGKGRDFMLWGVIALFVIFSLQGLIYLMCTAFLSSSGSCNFYPTS